MFCKRISALILFVATLALAGQAGATRFQTDLQLNSQVTSTNIDLVRFVWDTDQAEGNVSASALNELSVELFSGGISIYFDQVILNGVVQALPGFTRTLADVFWDYNLNTTTLSQFRNTLPSSMPSTTGTQFVVNDAIALPVDGIVVVQRFVDGVLQESVGGELLSQGTIRADFSIAVIPDTQLYAQTNSPIFAAQTQWILDNRVVDHIAYVTHLGDLKDSGGPLADVSCDDVDLGGGLTEWGYVARALNPLENPALTGGMRWGIPIGVLPGNHDFDQGGDNPNTCPGFNAGDPDGRPLSLYKARLGDAHFADRTYYGGSRPPDPVVEVEIINADNFTGDSYVLFSAGGIDFISINLGFRHALAPGVGSTSAEVRAANPEIQWADDLLAANPDRLGIVTSHFLLLKNNTVNGTNEFGPWAGRLYSEISGNKNLFMMLSAHEFGEGYRIEARAGMQPVHILLSDYQQYRYPGANTTDFSALEGLTFPNGDSGFMRIMRFEPTNGVVDISTFAPPVSDLGRTTTLVSTYAPFDALVDDGVLSASDISTINSSNALNVNTASRLRILLNTDGYIINSVTGAPPVARSGLGSGDLLVNGVSIGAIAANVSAVTQGNNAAAAINAVSSVTGVEASVDTATGALTLTTSDRRDIRLTAGTASAAFAQNIQNATGLDVSAGEDASGNETRSMTLNAVPGNGETIEIENRSYEFVDIPGSQASGNVGVPRAAGDVNTTAANLESAIDAEYAAGRTAVVASVSGNVVTLTSDQLGVNTTPVTDNTSDVSVGNAAGGTAAADGDGVTNRNI